VKEAGAEPANALPYSGRLALRYCRTVGVAVMRWFLQLLMLAPRARGGAPHRDSGGQVRNHGGSGVKDNSKRNGQLGLTSLRTAGH